MMNRASAWALLSGLLLGACGGGHASKAPNGQVTFSAQTHAVSQIPSGTLPPSVCGSFTLQPYSLDATGTPTLAGSPVTLSSSATSTSTAAILGCIDNPQVPGNDWGYIVTATNFIDCSTGAAIAGLSPSIVTQNFPVDCVAGQDVPLAISVAVSIPHANDAGYIDISVAVNSTTVQTGCKAADTGADGMIHFGESYLDASGNPAGGPQANHEGIVGLEKGSPQQWAGIVTGGTSEDTYYTGELSPGAPGLIFQTFVNPCAAGEYADGHHAQCLTQVGKGSPHTIATLADVFLSDPAWGYVSASIDSTGTIQLYSNVAPVNLMTATPANATGVNALATQRLLPPAGFAFTGLFIDHGTADQLLATGTDAGGVPVYWTLSWNTAASTWLLSSAAAPISSLTSTVATCLGLYGSDSGACVTPAPCFTLKIK